MKLTLEKAEIVTIIGKHFDAQLDPDNVIIRTDPFEIEVRGLPLTSNDPAPKEPETFAQLAAQTYNHPGPRAVAPVRDDEDATTEPPPPGKDGIDGQGVDVHPAAVLAQSKALEAELERENPQLKRRKGNYTHTAPEDYKKEIE